MLSAASTEKSRSRIPPATARLTAPTRRGRNLAVIRRHLLSGPLCYDGKLCVAYAQWLIDTERALHDAGVTLGLPFTLESWSSAQVIPWLP